MKIKNKISNYTKIVLAIIGFESASLKDIINELNKVLAA